MPTRFTQMAIHRLLTRGNLETKIQHANQKAHKRRIPEIQRLFASSAAAQPRRCTLAKRCPPSAGDCARQKERESRWCYLFFGLQLTRALEKWTTHQRLPRSRRAACYTKGYRNAGYCTGTSRCEGRPMISTASTRKSQQTPKAAAAAGAYSHPSSLATPKSKSRSMSDSTSQNAMLKDHLCCCCSERLLMVSNDGIVMLFLLVHTLCRSNVRGVSGLWVGSAGSSTLFSTRREVDVCVRSSVISAAVHPMKTNCVAVKNLTLPKRIDRPLRRW